MRALVASICCLFSSSLLALEAPEAMVPKGVKPGETFYIVFVTAANDIGTFSSVEKLNEIANLEADSSNFKGTDDPNIEWKAMFGHADGTVQTANLFEQADAAIYNLNGDKIADDVADMFDGNLDAPIAYEQSGFQVSSLVLTSFSAEGETVAGGLATADGSCPVGLAGHKGAAWAMSGPSYCGSGKGDERMGALYVVSPLLTAPGEPEVSQQMAVLNFLSNLLPTAAGGKKEDEEQKE
ncbi:hypothetical protein [uncultured Pseudoteredinibacter sp.]|uniref:hypothetical protein n=1 Tax=uncultured Pseudoteredinibacter sp. TaxID=1641701 RepID=UPI0026363768|nr:hypothetical protein [uncultured Pseudoteredinibacter sp.]